MTDELHEHWVFNIQTFICYRQAAVPYLRRVKAAGARDGPAAVSTDPWQLFAEWHRSDATAAEGRAEGDAAGMFGDDSAENGGLAAGLMSLHRRGVSTR